jgi:hypothetical protein
LNKGLALKGRGGMGEIPYKGSRICLIRYALSDTSAAGEGTVGAGVDPPGWCAGGRAVCCCCCCWAAEDGFA